MEKGIKRLNIDKLGKIMTVIFFVDATIVGGITRTNLGNPDFDLMDMWFIWVHFLLLFVIWIIVMIKWYKDSPPKEDMYMSNGKKRGWL
jgi:hypothetical protein